MADYFTPTVVRPAIPIADITPLERLLLSHIFNAEPEGEGLYFYADERPANTVWLDRAPLEAALAQSKAHADSAAAAFVIEQLARVPPDDVEIELDVGTLCWEAIFQDIVRRSPRLRYVSAIAVFTCSKMSPDGFGGMAVLITADTVMRKSTGDIIADFLKQGRARLCGRAGPGVKRLLLTHSRSTRGSLRRE